MALIVTERLIIPDSDLEVRAVRASGPGGQNVNKVATKVQIRFAVATTKALSEPERARLWFAQAGRISVDGFLQVSCDQTRSQETNKSLALAKLAALIRSALLSPKARLQTRPSRRAKQRRLDDKRKQGRLKQARTRREDES